MTGPRSFTEAATGSPPLQCEVCGTFPAVLALKGEHPWGEECLQRLELADLAADGWVRFFEERGPGVVEGRLEQRRRYAGSVVLRAQLPILNRQWWNKTTKRWYSDAYIYDWVAAVLDAIFLERTDPQTILVLQDLKTDRREQRAIASIHALSGPDAVWARLDARFTRRGKRRRRGPSAEGFPTP